MSLCKISLYKKIINFCKVSLCKKSKVLKSSFALLFAFMLFFMHSAVAAGGGQDASLWDVKDELHKSANYYIWIIYIVCGVIAFFLVSSALASFKMASEGGGQNQNGHRRGCIHLLIAGLLMSLAFNANVLISAVLGSGIAMKDKDGYVGLDDQFMYGGARATDFKTTEVDDSSDVNGEWQ